MKNMKKLTAMLLTLVMSLALAAPCFAADMSDTGGYLGTVWSIDSEGNRIPIIVDEIDDGSNDRDEAAPFGVSFALFTMYLSAMKYSLHTTDNKSFTKDDLTRGNVKIDGTLESENPDGIVGFAYYDGGYIATDWLNNIVDCGTYFEFFYPQSSFNSRYYYYGYAQSRYPGTSPYSGAIHYWNSDR